MLHAVFLTFDDETTAALDRIARQIEPIPGPIPPHITLGMLEIEDQTGLERTIRSLAAEVGPFPVVFSSIGCFPGDQAVLFAAPVVTETLLATHQRFDDAFAAISPSIERLYRPGTWVPHCTLAMRLGPERIDQAFTTARTLSLPLPLTGKCAAIAIVRFPAVEVWATIPLGHHPPR